MYIYRLSLATKTYGDPAQRRALNALFSLRSSTTYLFLFIRLPAEPLDVPLDNPYWWNIYLPPLHQVKSRSP